MRETDIGETQMTAALHSESSCAKSTESLRTVIRGIQEVFETVLRVFQWKLIAPLHANVHGIFRLTRMMTSFKPHKLKYLVFCSANVTRRTMPFQYHFPSASARERSLLSAIQLAFPAPHASSTSPIPLPCPQPRSPHVLRASQHAAFPFHIPLPLPPPSAVPLKSSDLPFRCPSSLRALGLDGSLTRSPYASRWRTLKRNLDDIQFICRTLDYLHPDFKKSVNQPGRQTPLFYRKSLIAIARTTGRKEEHSESSKRHWRLYRIR